MAVQVGNSWVSEAAYAYAQKKASGKKSQKNSKSTLENLSEEFKDLKFTTDTKPFSGTGKNNMAIAPNILKEMENDPDKKLEYEALLYDCNEAVKNLPEKTANGAKIQSFGFIIHADGSLSGWSVSESGKGTEKERYSLDKEKKDSWTEQMFGKKAEKADTYDKTDRTEKATYSVSKMSAEERAGLVKKLQAEQEARQQQLVDIVKKMLDKQANTYGKATGIWNFLSGGGYTVDAATKAQAQKDISEDGYYGVKQTSQRLFDFASALAGDDVEQMKKMQKAMEKGFRQATGAWGGKGLPSICQETFAAANKLFEEYYASKRSEEGAE